MAFNAGFMIVAAIAAALPSAAVAQAEQRLAVEDIVKLPSLVNAEGLGAGNAVRVIKLYGDPAKAGRYVVRLVIPAHTIVYSRTHTDLRTATVISGTWHMGYGKENDPTRAKDLGAGSFFSEPAGRPIFGATVAEAAIIDITGTGPSHVVYVKQ